MPETQEAWEGVFGEHARSNAPGAALRPAAAERRWHAGAVPHGGVPPWGQRVLLRGVTATCAAALAALLAIAFLSDVGRGTAPAGWGTTVIYQSSAGETPPRPLSPGQPARRTQPRAVTLQLSDLPPGARVTREGPASFSPSAQPPPSWDVVMRPDPAQPADYEFAESLSVVYSSDRVAASAMASLAASERANSLRAAMAHPITCGIDGNRTTTSCLLPLVG